jgi:hypothetical protein
MLTNTAAYRSPLSRNRGVVYFGPAKVVGCSTAINRKSLKSPDRGPLKRAVHAVPALPQDKYAGDRCA